MLIDTHCHVYFDAFDQDRDSVIAAARHEGVQGFVVIGIDSPSNRQSIQLANQEPDMVATVGLHPHHAHEVTDDTIDEMRQMVKESNRVVAIGEIGLDYYKSKADKDNQLLRFTQCVDLALELDLPVVVHSRNAFSDTLNVLVKAKEKHSKLKALFHCYTYDAVAIRQIAQYDFYASFSGIVTFNNATDIQDAAKAITPNRYVIETDCPYLAPHPNRGKRNEPRYLKHIAEYLAELRNESFEQIAQTTTDNAFEFFNLNRFIKQT